ncbi:aminotransferase class IV, partial [Desulfitobacterium sp.]|uniref:aminotransferase class IV n=1 Tax=Desulfitobacterium sp. TaxID=49981 RepID=UPI002D1702B7
AQERGALEGICLNSQGYIAEGSMSNLFFILNGILYTPALSSGCLPGTRRFMVLECARSLGIPYQEGEFLPRLLEQAQEIFLTNALMGILPVKQIENWPILTRFQSPNSLTAHISKAYTAYLQSQSQGGNLLP